MSEQPIRIFISGACAGLAEARDALASHKDIELVGTASEPSKAGAKLASTGAQVILHALQRPDSVPVEEIQKIREHTAAPIILLVTRSTPSLLDEAVELGLNDVMLLPQLTDNLVFTVKKAHTIGSVGPGGGAQRRSGDSSRVITLFSPKGGVGKTVLATNMAAMFAKRLKMRTLLIDLDLQFGDGAIMLGADPRTTILDLVMSHGDLDADKLLGYVTHHESGLHILPAPVRPEDADLVTEDRLASVLAAAKQAYDVVLLDTAPNFTSTVLTALDRTDELLLVGSLETTSLKSVKICIQTLEMLHYPLERCHVVLNRADTKVGLRKDHVEGALGKAIRFGIPSNKAVPTAINRGVPVVMTDPKADVTRAIREMCVALSPGTVMSDASWTPAAAPAASGAQPDVAAGAAFDEAAAYAGTPAGKGPIPRAIACLLDVSVITAFTVLAIIGMAAGVSLQTAISMGWLPGVIALVYLVGFETLLGRTPGKVLLGMKIVDEHGDKLSFIQALLRFIGGIVDWFVIGLVGAILIATSPTKQRLGDRMAGTYVVSSRTPKQAAYEPVMPADATGTQPSAAPHDPEHSELVFDLDESAAA